MKVGKKFNLLSLKEYYHLVDNYKKYTDFNRLGLYRSIFENEKITLKEKIEIRDYANTFFGKTFNFYQLKDPSTYFNLITLGENLTDADTKKIWKEIVKNQELILKEKRIKHRNFGSYSKHDCGYDNCHLNGLMIKQGDWFSESTMFFDSDKNKYCLKEKSNRFKKERKDIHKIIKNELENDDKSKL